MSRSEPVYHLVSGTITDLDSSAQETTIQLPSDKAEAWLLVSMHLIRTGGSSSNWVPRLGKASGWTLNDINEIIDYSSTALTTIRDVYSVPIPFKCDANGRIYLNPVFDGSSDDDDAKYEFWFQKLRGG